MNKRFGIQIGPGIVTDDTVTAINTGNWADSSLVRFWRGLPQTINGWEFNTTDTFAGICRNMFAWRDKSGILNIAIGTNTGLYLWQDGEIYDITPTTGFTPGNADGYGGAGYGTGPYGTGGYGLPTNSNAFPLTWSFDSYGEWLIANPRGQGIFVWKNNTAAPAVLLASDTTTFDADFTTYANQTAFDVDWTRGTGWTFDATGDEADSDGTQVAVSNLTRSVTTVAGRTYRVTITFTKRSAGTIAALAAGTAGTSSSSASGTVTTTFLASGASTVVGAQADADFIGSVNDMVIQQLGAPNSVGWIVVDGMRRQIVAYGCNEELSDVFNPRCIRWCDFEAPTVWYSSPSNNAGEYILESAGRLVSARKTSVGTFVWTESELFFQTFLGDPSQTFNFQRQGTNCGLIGPLAAAVAGSTAFWITPAIEFMTAGIGAEPQGMQSPLRREIADNLAPVQQEKIAACTISRFNEIWWTYPDARDGNGLECSRIVAVSTVGNGWMRHRLARTSLIDSNPMEYPCMADASGYLYWHEKGFSANGGPMNAYTETGDIRLSEGSAVMLMRGMWNDFDDQQGNLSLTVRTKLFPQDTYQDFGPYTLAPAASKRDFMASGRFISLRLESNTAPTFWRASSFNVEGTVRGSR